MKNIPIYWKSLKLSEIVIARKGKKPLRQSHIPFTDSVPYLDIDAVENNNIKQYADSLTTLLSTKEDIFIVADGSRSGLVARGIVGAVGSTLLCLTPLVINRDYLYYFLESQFEYFNKNTKGASIPHLNIQLLFDLEVPLPPPDEQIIIATELKNKLEEYQKDFIGAKDELEKVKQFKRSVLEKAISGTLTQSWRKKNLLEAKKAMSDLLSLNSDAKIYEKEQIWKNLPSFWVITDAKSICTKITDGEHITPPRLQKGELLLSARNVRDGYIDYENVDYISKQELKRLRLRCNPERNDVLIVSVGATIGRTSVVTDDLKFALVRSVLLLKPMISGEFLMYCLQSPILQNLIQESCKGVAQAHLYITETNLLKLPFPSLKEQLEIVRLVKEHIETANRIEADTAFTIHRMNDLQRAIFQMAFTGNLSSDLKFTGKEDNHWFKSFKEAIIVQRENQKIRNKTIATLNKTLSKEFIVMISSKKRIVESIEGSPNTEISVLDAWRQSEHYDSGNIEGFYEELVTLSKRNKTGKVVKWEFEGQEKNNVILKFK